MKNRVTDTLDTGGDKMFFKPHLYQEYARDWIIEKPASALFLDIEHFIYLFVIPFNLL